MDHLTLLQRQLTAAFPELDLRLDEMLARYTSFRIGGPAEVMAFPRNQQELARLLQGADQMGIRPVILGAGTNILASDAGRRGLVICTKGCLDGVEQVDSTHIRALAGTTMAKLATFAANVGLSGLEFAHGIPGSVGGGLYMNAGAYGGEMKQVAESVQYFDQKGRVFCRSGSELAFSYRHSMFTGTDHVIVSAVFALTKAPEADIKSRMQELMQKRRSSQPLEYPSAGSTFKRPQNGYAAALIEQAGLKGRRVGDAAVSEKHAGFVVNLGHATQRDVLDLIGQIQTRVMETSGIFLEPEVIRLSER